MFQIRDWISPRGIMRLLVLSYFIALSLGWIGGSGVMQFMLPLLPPDIALRVMQGLILGLSLLILIGIGRRHAALVLALVVFFSSYTALYAGGDISAFWRDLALIGALLMTADFKGPKDQEGLEEPFVTDSAPERTPPQLHDAPIVPLTDQAFREDFDIAQAK